MPTKLKEHPPQPILNCTSADNNNKLELLCVQLGVHMCVQPCFAKRFVCSIIMSCQVLVSYSSSKLCVCIPKVTLHHPCYCDCQHDTW